jgi:hypothetical protein
MRTWMLGVGAGATTASLQTHYTLVTATDAGDAGIMVFMLGVLLSVKWYHD